MYVATQQSMEMCVWKFGFAFDQTLCRAVDTLLSQLKL